MTAMTDVAGKPRVSPWNDPGKRALLVQIVLLVVFAILAYEIVQNTLANLRSRNISSASIFSPSLPASTSSSR